MANWKLLEDELARWLEGFAGEGLEYRNPNQAIIGFPSDGFRSDGMLTDGRTLVAIEVEAAQMHPDTNVGKYWLLAEKYPQYQMMYLFHIYTPDFNSYGWRMDLAEFYGHKMEDEHLFHYELVDFRDAKDYGQALQEIKSMIRPILHQAFLVESP